MRAEIQPPRSGCSVHGWPPPPHWSSGESFSCSQCRDVTSSQPPQNLALPMAAHNCLSLWFQGFWYSHLASKGTAHTQHTYIHVSKIIYS